MDHGPTPGTNSWPRLLSLASHEVRNPISVVGGYIRMLVTEKVGPISAPQRKLLEEATKSCGRLAALADELSQLARFEEGTAPFHRKKFDLNALLTETITALPPLPDREVAVTLENQEGRADVEGDAARLKTALSSVLFAVRRELVTGDGIQVRLGRRTHRELPSLWIAIADPGRLDQLSSAGEDLLAPFDEWRGGCGLSLTLARRVIESHGGQVWSPAQDAKAGAVIVLPQAA